MTSRLLAAALCCLLTGLAQADGPAWSEVSPGVMRSAGLPCSYALIDGDAALLIGAARGVDAAELDQKIERVLVTHHHRDSIARLREFIESGAKASAPKASADWILPEQVGTFWKTAMPRPAESGREPPLKERTFNDWVYLVLPEGIANVDCSLIDGQEIEWRSWRITCLATPGHSRDHMAYGVRKEGSDETILFCGDAMSSAGKMPTPYTTDWEHWSGRGLQAAAQSLRRLAALNPGVICPEQGPPIHERPALALYETAMNAAEASFLKSYERYSKERLGNPPPVQFLAKAQVTTAGDEPWTELTPHLFLTGNTFALASKAGPIMLLDAYGPKIAQQVAKLQKDRKLGPLEVVTISHAHNDHYKGIYLLPDREKFEVWTQARVAEPLLAPYRYCAPYVDARPLKVDRELQDGARVRWREYDFIAHHLPGQTEFSMGWEVTIDGHKCFFTGDSYYHADQFGGSGGWSGRNRGLPLPYAASAEKILAAKPEWILCEHGGAFTFEAEDFRRRIAWANEAAKAGDALSPSGNHRRDWQPQLFRMEPLLQTAQPGEKVVFSLICDSPPDGRGMLSVEIAHDILAEPWRGKMSLGAQRRVSREVDLLIAADAPPGRYVVPVTILRGDAGDGSDTFCVLDIGPN
jgi:glyoxylase-like metal-dependent hydrolase (beta-lactamase superfamily II)